MIDKKLTRSLTKNSVLLGRSKRIDTKFHFLRNQVPSGVLEVVHYGTQKQLAYVMELVLLSFSLEYELNDYVSCNSIPSSYLHFI